jgi:hypothetical protein
MARTDIELDIYPLSIALQSKKITTSRTSFHITGGQNRFHNHQGDREMDKRD